MSVKDYDAAFLAARVLIETEGDPTRAIARLEEQHPDDSPLGVAQEDAIRVAQKAIHHAADDWRTR